MNSNPTSRDRSRRLVDFVFLWCFDLICHIELQQMQPNPERSIYQSNGTGQGGSRDGKQCLVWPQYQKTTGSKQHSLPVLMQ